MSEAAAAPVPGAWRIYRRLLGYARPYLPFLGIAVLGMLVEAASAGMNENLNRQLTDALAAQHRGDLAAAAPLFHKILEHDPEQADALHGLGLFDYEQGRPAEALQKMQDMAIANTSGVLYGPVPLKDGTYGLFGIDPIYFYTNQNRFEYWGASLILLRVPDALQMADFESLLEAGYVYRVRSLTGPEWAPPVIAASEEPLQDNPVTSVIHIPNGQWILETSPVNGWLNLRGIIWELVAGLGISVLLALIVYTFLMLREEREVMRAQAETDPLTRLSNRRLLMDEITERCNSAPGHFLICYLDLNNFKQVNDTYGHDVGDELIKAASDRIRGALKEEDSLFRVGGDEFVAIVEPEKGEGWKARLELLDREMRQMFVFGDGKICIDISVSMGCAVYPQNAVRAEELLRLADMRMLENKERFAHN